MEEVFKQLEEHEVNTVTMLVNWMKDANIINNEAAEQNAKELLGRSDDDKVELNKFQELIQNTAKEQQKSVDQLNKQLSEHGLIPLGALEVKEEAFKDYLEKHKCF